MREAAAFVGSTPLVAHNAAFDRKFWVDELQRAGCDAGTARGDIDATELESADRLLETASFLAADEVRSRHAEIFEHEFGAVDALEQLPYGHTQRER
jgi:DNA polymerase III alpha subunit (gram-positive type)